MREEREVEEEGERREEDRDAPLGTGQPMFALAGPDRRGFSLCLGHDGRLRATTAIAGVNRRQTRVV